MVYLYCVFSERWGQVGRISRRNEASDPFVPLMYHELLLRNIPKVRLPILPEGRHNTHRSHDETCSRLVRDFLREDTTP